VRRALGLFDDPAQARRIGVAGRQVVETRFSLLQFAESVARIYASVLGSGVDAPAFSRGGDVTAAPLVPPERIPR